MDDLNRLSRALMTLEERLAACNRCGLCQSVCPVYAETLLETDVSRGKLVLLQDLAHNLLDDPEGVAERLSRCALCGACESACPSGVDTFELFLDARAIVYNYLGLSPIKKMLFRTLLPRPALLNILLSAGQTFRELVLTADNNPQQTCTAPALAPFIGKRHLPAIPARPLSAAVGALNIAAGKSRIKVAFFPGCMGDKVYTAMSQACLRVFDHHEVGVFLPAEQVCCGLPALAAGDTVGFEKMVARNVDILKAGTFDYIVSPCPSCTTAFKNLWADRSKRMSAGYRDAINGFAMKAIDINSLLVDILKVRPSSRGRTAKGKVPLTYHEPCHLRLSLGISAQPRALLRMNPNYNLVEHREADHCCGCGGTFTLAHPELSTQIGLRKASHIAESGAEVVATACPACVMQISDAMARQKQKTIVKHVIEIYSESI